MNRISLIYLKGTKWPNLLPIFITNVKDENWERMSPQFGLHFETETYLIASEFKEYIDPNDKFPGVKWFDSLSENRPNIWAKYQQEQQILLKA